MVHLTDGWKYATIRIMGQEHRICDYEESSYKTDFWEGKGREYEDLAERIALRHMLPPPGQRLIDIGPGFGRLSEFYEGYDQVILLDYSRSLLRQAQERLGRSERFVYVAANFYTMPFQAGVVDTAMMVRVMHHVEDVPTLLHEVGRVLDDDGTFVLEFASKRHLKAILRYALRRQEWSPFDPSPEEFVEMNFDFHPDWMRERLVEAGFHVKQQRTVSHFRLPALKRIIPPSTLAAVDGLIQPTGAWWQLTPSVFVACAQETGHNPTPATGLFCCPTCTATDLVETDTSLDCQGCDQQWTIDDGIYVFTGET
jgi:ubiquinone/menaquinone biosynthesis C-methylase UbiE